MNIDTLPAGRELDALVAERAMGWTKVKVQTESEFGGASTFVLYGTSPINQPWKRVPAYSTDIAATWEIAEKLGPMWLYKTTAGKPSAAAGQLYACSLGSSVLEREWSYGDTAPLAICRAALKAVGA